PKRIAPFQRQTCFSGALNCVAVCEIGRTWRTCDLADGHENELLEQSRRLVIQEDRNSHQSDHPPSKLLSTNGTRHFDRFANQSDPECRRDWRRLSALLGQKFQRSRFNTAMAFSGLLGNKFTLCVAKEWPRGQNDRE